MTETKSNISTNKHRTLYFDLIRTIAIISITLNHAVNRTYDNYSNQYAQYLESSNLSTFIKTFITVFSHVGVPLFLMLTGALIINRDFEKPETVKKFIKNNYLNLLITTEIWIFIMFWFIVTLFPKNLILENGGISAGFESVIKCMFFTDWTTSGVNQTSFASMWYMPMILSLYPLLPFISILIKKYSPKVLIIPMALSYLYLMVLPLINQQIIFLGGKTISSYLKNLNLPSYFLIYIILGYFVDNGLFEKLKNHQVVILTILSFGLCFAYQWYAYSRPQNYLVDYNFPLLPIAAAFIFESTKRISHIFNKCKPLFTYISSVSFGIYFVHILIMDYIENNHDLSFMRYPVKMLSLELVAVVGSILIIFLLSKVKFFKKYLFMMK